MARRYGTDTNQTESSEICWPTTHPTHIRKELGNVLFNDALNTFYLRLYGVRHMVKDHSDSERGNSQRHMGYSFRSAAWVLLYASSHRQDSTYDGLCYTSRGALAGTRCNSIGSPWRIDPTIHRTMRDALTTELHLAPHPHKYDKTISEVNI